MTTGHVVAFVLLCLAPVSGLITGALAGLTIRAVLGLPLFAPDSGASAVPAPVPQTRSPTAPAALTDAVEFRPIGRLQEGPAAVLRELVEAADQHFVALGTAPTIEAPRPPAHPASATASAPVVTPRPAPPAYAYVAAPPPASEPVTPLGVREGETCWTCGRPRAEGLHAH